jgi:imidazolonepropionase-like amidohydrolase
VATADIDVISHAALFVWEGASMLPEHYDTPHPFNPFGPPAPYGSVSPRDPRVIRVLESMRRRGIILDPTIATMRLSVSAQAEHWAIELAKVAHAMRIPMTVGTDGVSIFEELDVLVDSVGFTPGEALISATSVGAAAIGVSGELGAVVVGNAADLVAYRSDPTASIRNLRQPLQVIARGRLVRMLRSSRVR